MKAYIAVLTVMSARSPMHRGELHGEELTAGEEPVEDLLAADLALVGGAVALALKGGAKVEHWNTIEIG